MTKLRSLLAAFLTLAGVASADIPRPTDAPQPRTPAASAASFKLPDGFRMEVVASEPVIASPSGVCWDERGRMFICELHGYNLEGQLDIEELNKTGQLDTQVRRVEADERFKRAAQAGTHGVVKMLQDLDHDGRMDAAVVWATNLPAAYGIVPARGGVIVACAPDIVFLADLDGDGKPEVREVLFTGFRVGEMWRGINSPQWGADGWIYFGRGWGGSVVTGPKLIKPLALPDTDFRIRSDGSAIEPVTGGTGTFGFALTETGDRFTENTTIPAIYIAPLPWNYLARNPDASAPALEAPTGDPRAWSISKPHPWRQKRADDPAYFKYYNSRYGAAESEADGWFTAVCGPLVYRDRALPGLHGQYFVCEPAGNLIHRAIIEADGTVLKIHRAPGEQRSEFAATSDAWSHPIQLTHGPDGSIWVTDYYREIIEDYSAIPRHLQQQYGVYQGHDHGRVYRLTHRDAPPGPPADMHAMDAAALARECASPIFWRRGTAQRLIVERGTLSAAPMLRGLLGANPPAEASAVITALRTLDGLGVLTPDDVRPMLRHRDPAVRVHALQLADRWFARNEGRALLDATLAAAAAEQEPRVLIQLALSLGEARESRAFATLATLARRHSDLRWMGAAILSGLAGRATDMLSELLREPGYTGPFLGPLAQAIAARRDEAGLTRTLKMLAYVSPEAQSAVLDGLAKGRRNAPRGSIADPFARAALAALGTNASASVRKPALALAETFVAAAIDDEAMTPTSNLRVESVSEETFGRFKAALRGARDQDRGRRIYQQACAPCHRIGDEGHEVGPDLMGQLGMAEETLLHDILTPSARIRPGYETTEVKMRDGSVVPGLLRDDGATSLRLVQAGGAEQVLLRKDVAEVRRLTVSLMPPFAESMSPADLANLLAWLRSRLGQAGNQPGEVSR